MKKPANRTNLVRGHVCEKMWTFFQNRNKFSTNHTFLEEIDHIEGRNFKIINDLLKMNTFWSIS